MRIEVRGRNLQVSDELREQVERRFAKVGKQVAEQALLTVELCEERTPGSGDRCSAEATLVLKGTTLRAKDASRDLGHAVNLVADELARQVKRHRDKRRNRRDARTPILPPVAAPEAPGGQLGAM